MVKALALLSGGLDSTLAIRIILEQGIEVEAVNFITVFCTCTPKQSNCLVSRKAANKLGIKLKVFDISEEYLKIVKDSKHGYGKNLNPCIDCRIFMLRKAREYMKKIGASFIITGEVLGERPMSQRKDTLRIIEHESGFKGLILRPLSARLLEPTIPEKKGWVNRESLLDIKGRSRKFQISLAEKFGIDDYPCPAGGCLLTDPGFSNRMRDLMEHKFNLTLNDVKLLKIGRHFRLSNKAKTIVGRNEDENRKLLGLSKEDDTILEVLDFPGPTSIIRGKTTPEEIAISAAITARYSKARNMSDVKVKYKRKVKYKKKEGKDSYIVVSPLNGEELGKLKI